MYHRFQVIEKLRDQMTLCTEDEKSELKNLLILILDQVSDFVILKEVSFKRVPVRSRRVLSLLIIQLKVFYAQYRLRDFPGFSILRHLTDEPAANSLVQRRGDGQECELRSKYQQTSWEEGWFVIDRLESWLVSFQALLRNLKE